MTDDVQVVIGILSGSDVQAAEEAALRLFDGELWAGPLVPHDELTEALTDSVYGGNLSPAAFVILARLDGAEAGDVLQAVAKGREDLSVKLHPWDKPVALPDALRPALILAAVPGARDDMLFRLETADPALMLYYLAVIDFIDSPEILHRLAASLDDETEVGGGAPAGAPAGVAEPRRLADWAVDAFIDRLSLEVDFARNPHGRYLAEQIVAVKQAIRASIPQ